MQGERYSHYQAQGNGTRKLNPLHDQELKARISQRLERQLLHQQVKVLTV